MPTNVTIMNIGRKNELINGTSLPVGATLVVDLEDPDVMRELRGDMDYVILPDSAAGTLPVSSGGGIELLHFDYDFAVDGGAQGVINLGALEDDKFLASVWVHCITPLTSTGSVISIGTTGSSVSSVTGMQGFDSGLEFVTAGRVSEYPMPLGSFEVTAVEELTFSITDDDLTGGKLHIIAALGDIVEPA